MTEEIIFIVVLFVATIAGGLIELFRKRRK
jgi:hypothetical protein